MEKDDKKLTISKRIENLVKQIVEAEGLELVDVEFKSGPRGVLRIFLDKPGGVNISDCQKISSRAGASLEEEDFIKSEYVLEVSSPGLDRPLKREADYKRYKGKLVNISLYAPLEGKKNFIGHIINAGNNKVTLKEKNEKVIDIPIADIAKGKLEIEF